MLKQSGFAGDRGRIFFADGIFFAKGIPYAEPPVGDLRWRPPVDMVFDEKLHLYSEFGASCFANKKKPFSSVLSEDCLYLNVWSPDLGGKLPVMVWIHGGGLSNGHGNVAGELLAEKGVVVVSLNYRLGPLGFFAHPELETNDPNFGFQDQISALRWVARNIKRFGGDPERVTIFGNSAGALSVDILTTHPEAGGLFRRAVAQSSYIGWQRHFMQKLHDDTKTDFSGRKLGIAEDQAVSFVTEAGIDSGTSLGKLRQQDPTLFTNQQKVQILPIVDDDAFKVDHFGCVRDEKCGNQIDAYMTGFTSFEGQWLSRRWLADDKNQEWIRNNWEKIRVVYRDDVQKRVELAHARFIGDMMFLNSSHLSAVANFQNGTKVYTYYADAGIVFENGDKIGTPHGADSNIFWT